MSSVLKVLCLIQHMVDFNCFFISHYIQGKHQYCCRKCGFSPLVWSVVEVETKVLLSALKTSICLLNFLKQCTLEKELENSQGNKQQSELCTGTVAVSLKLDIKVLHYILVVSYQNEIRLFFHRSK